MMRVAFPKTGKAFEEPDCWTEFYVKIDTGRLGEEKAEEFWDGMRTWEWSQDRELFWLGKLIPATGEGTMRGVSVYSSNMVRRVAVLLKVLGRVYPELEALVRMKYASSMMLWDMGIPNYGGHTTVTLSDGKVETNDMAYA